MVNLKCVFPHTLHGCRAVRTGGVLTEVHRRRTAVHCLVEMRRSVSLPEKMFCTGRKATTVQLRSLVQFFESYRGAVALKNRVQMLHASVSVSENISKTYGIPKKTLLDIAGFSQSKTVYSCSLISIFSVDRSFISNNLLHETSPGSVSVGLDGKKVLASADRQGSLTYREKSLASCAKDACKGYIEHPIFSEET